MPDREFPAPVLDPYKLANELNPERDGEVPTTRRTGVVTELIDNARVQVQVDNQTPITIPTIQPVAIGQVVSLLAEREHFLCLGAEPLSFPVQSLELDSTVDAVFTWPVPVTRIEFGWSGRSTATTQTLVRLQFNGDTGTNYQRRLSVFDDSIGWRSDRSTSGTGVIDISIGRIGPDTAFREGSFTGNVTVSGRAAVDGQGTYAEGTTSEDQFLTTLGGGLYDDFNPNITSMRIYVTGGGVMFSNSRAYAKGFVQ